MAQKCLFSWVSDLPEISRNFYFIRKCKINPFFIDIQKADEMAQKSFFSWVSDLPEISRLAEPVITWAFIQFVLIKEVDR